MNTDPIVVDILSSENVKQEEVSWAEAASLWLGQGTIRLTLAPYRYSQAEQVQHVPK